jgi:hypothetical protein
VADVVYIDVSAKVEQWNQDSAVAVSDGRSWTVLFPSTLKRVVRQYFVERHGSKNLQFRMLAFLVYVAVREHLGGVEQIVIDQDYIGRNVEVAITNFLLAWLRIEQPEIRASFIRFERVRGSKADKLARAVFGGKLAAGKTVTIDEVNRLLRK